MAARFAWVLNLDADLELARGRGYSPRRSVEEGSRAWRARIASTLLGEDDVLLEDLPNGDARGLVGRAFCPTPRAIARLERAGAAPEPHPPFDVLRRVASRAFSASLGSTLPGAELVADVDAALAKLETCPPIGRDWRLKRAFGMAGRGQRVVTPGAPVEADVALVRASI